LETEQEKIAKRRLKRQSWRRAHKLAVIMHAIWMHAIWRDGTVNADRLHADGMSDGSPTTKDRKLLCSYLTLGDPFNPRLARD
jgi:hypothetical protein